MESVKIKMMNKVYEILFVIVLYKQSLAESKSYQTITDSLIQLGVQEKTLTLYVYDNSPVENQQLEDGFWNIIFITDINNSGLSVAYNRAAAYAKKHLYKYLFLLDQDTTFPSNTISIYLENIKKHPDIKLFAPILMIQDGKIMSPYKQHMKWGKFLQHVKPGIHCMNKTAPVNSGMCISVEEFWKVKGYNERVRVDGADYQFTDRFKKENNEYFVVPVVAYQDFSMFETELSKLTTRYSLFLEDVSNFDRNTMTDSFFYFILKLKRTLRLTYETKNTVFIKSLLKSFFR